MKIAARIRQFFAIGLAAPCLTPLLLAGCAGYGAGPDGASRPVVASPTQPDGYPNLNLPVEAAAPQITEEEKAQLTQELSAKRRRPEEPSAAAAAEAERLRRLARQHQEEMLKEIEGANSQ
ncbi:hypothetical protein [Chelativorans sp. AA-79]|uniref:hypothetical protein n=1 Tax=Chelativorans sp. AA-79 TaxID=3028735 RepID=UPI0023F8D304|nr:hypothetical protein [Chelativorans sp. AA-79]WEX07587.1 hypothetical protein PVE73_15895 [Chelativorans sp. AA-79]